jgi:hypothetical protein
MHRHHDYLAEDAVIIFSDGHRQTMVNVSAPVAEQCPDLTFSCFGFDIAKFTQEVRPVISFSPRFCEVRRSGPGTPQPLRHHLIFFRRWKRFAHFEYIGRSIDRALENDEILVRLDDIHGVDDVMFSNAFK